MKKYTLVVLLSWISVNVLFAQQENIFTNEQFVYLKNGVLLQGVVDEVDEKLMKITNGKGSYVVKKRKVDVTVPIDILFGNVEKPKEALVIFKNKEWLKAELLEANSKTVTLHSDGVTSIFSRKKILKIYLGDQEYAQAQKDLISEGDHNFLDVTTIGDRNVKDQESKVYNITKLSYLVLDKNKSDENTFMDGFGIQHTTGYKFNPHLGLGFHFGYTMYKNSNFRDFSFIDCFEDCDFGLRFNSIEVLSGGLSIRGELSQKKWRPYYNVDVGITKSLKEGDLNITISRFQTDIDYTYDEKESRPQLGYKVQPSIGVVFKLKTMDLLVDFGYEISKLNYQTGGFDFSDGDTFHAQTSNVELGSYVLKVGMKL